MLDVTAGMRPEKGDAQWKKLQNVFTDQLQMMSITDSNNFVPIVRYLYFFGLNWAIKTDFGKTKVKLKLKVKKSVVVTLLTTI